MKKCTKIILGTAVAGLAVTAGYIAYVKAKKANLPESFTVTAHTGCEGTKDNSLEAIEKGYLSGADIVEFDVHFNSNGEPVLAHDYAADNSVKLKDMKGLNLPEGADVFYLQKPQVSGDLINYLETLRKDIHKYSMVPDLTDKDYLSAQSGVAMRLKLQGLEFLTGVKESNFRKGLTRRLEILGDYLSLSNNDFDFDKALIVFKRNTVESLAEIIDNAIRLKDIISTESVIDMLPVVETKEELKRLDKEKEQNIQQFNIQSEIKGEEDPEE